MGIFNLGALVNIAGKGFKQPHGFGKKCYDETGSLLDAAAKLVGDNGDIDIRVLCEKIGRHLIDHSDSQIQQINYPGHKVRVQLVFPRLNFLSDQAKQIDLGPLVSKRSKNFYSSLGVFNLGALVDLAAIGFDQPLGFGRKCYVETVTLLLSASKILEEDGAIDIGILCEKIGRPLVAHPIADTLKTMESFIKAQFPVLRFTSEKLQGLSDSTKRQPLHKLHLDDRVATAMEDLGIKDVGEFVDKIKHGINAVNSKNFNKKSFNNLALNVLFFSYNVDDRGECDWLGYASMLGFKILPSENIVTARDVLNLFQECVRKAVEAQFENNKKYNLFIDIYNEKINTTIGEEKTLEQIGSRHSRSRERVRQLESKIIKCLSESLLNGCYSIPVLGNNGKTYEALRFRFRPAFEAVIKSAKTAFDSDARKVWRLDEWVRFLAEFWSADFKVIESNALLLSKLFSFSHHAQAVDGKIVGYLMIKDEVSTDVKQVLRETLKDIHIRMDGESGFIQVEEVLEPFEVEKLLIDLCISANQLVSFCLTLHSNSKDLWKIKEEFYKPNIGKMICDTAEEILKELNQRMHFQDLYRKVTNHFSKMDISERYFSAKLHYDFRFQCIGKTGYWVLAAWNYERGTIFECLCKVLGGEQEPMHIKDITRCVQEMTPAAPNSIKSYLQIRSDVFIKLPGNRYDLRERYPNRSKIDDEF
jgi:DNA-directed RNA polymerase delta subunit